MESVDSLFQLIVRSQLVRLSFMLTPTGNSLHDAQHRTRLLPRDCTIRGSLRFPFIDSQNESARWIRWEVHLTPEGAGEAVLSSCSRCR